VNPWTQEEDAIIKKHYRNDRKYLFKALKHRTKSAIYHRASRLNISDCKRDFTQEEDAFICQHYFANKQFVYSTLKYRNKHLLTMHASLLKKKDKIEKWSKQELGDLKKEQHEIYIKHFEARKLKNEI
jgi:hypothetical protein